MKAPNFDDLVGPEVVGEERAHLRRAHDLLVAAGPPPEVPARLASPPVASIGRRRLAVVLLAAALSVAAFAGGWLARGNEDDAFAVRRVVAMHATAHARGASAELKLGVPDANGNWEMLVTVRGLKPLPEGGYYELLLTDEHGEPVATCGSFKVRARGSTTVRLGASYDLREYKGWVVRPYVHDRERLNETIYLTT